MERIKTSFLQVASSSICPHKSTYLFSGSYTELISSMLLLFLQEYMMLETIKSGIPRYNFLGIQGIFDGSDGVLRFKQNSMAPPPQIGEKKKNLSPPLR